MLEGSLAEAGQALIGGVKVRQCSNMSNFILQMIFTVLPNIWSFSCRLSDSGQKACFQHRLEIGQHQTPSIALQTDDIAMDVCKAM